MNRCIYLAQTDILLEDFYSSNSAVADPGSSERQGRRGVDCQALDCGEKGDVEEELHNREVGGSKGHCNGDLDSYLEVFVIAKNVVEEVRSVFERVRSVFERVRSVFERVRSVLV
jgi:hypothetical protein